MFNFLSRSKSQIKPIEDFPIEGLEKSLKNTQIALNLVLDDRLKEGLSLLEQNQIEKSDYPQDPFTFFGIAIIDFQSCIMGNEEEQLERVSQKLLKTEQIVSQWIKRCEQYISEGEAHLNPIQQTIFQIKLVLEIILADCYLMLTIAAFLTQSISDFAKAAYRLRKSYTLFNQVKVSIKNSPYLNQLKPPQLNDDKDVDLNTTPPLSVTAANTFVGCIFSGIHFGSGLFELLISSLPKRAKSILTTLGFPNADKSQAIQLLKHSLVYEGIHGPMAALVLTSFYSGWVSFLSHRPSSQTKEFQEAKLVIAVIRQTFTQSKIWMMMDSKFLKLECRLQEADALLDQALNTKSDTLKELDLLISYDQGWIKMMIGEYKSANRIFNQLKVDTDWSKAFYCYCQACCWLITGNSKQALECFQQVPSLIKKRMGGRILPIEMFIKHRIEFYVHLIAKIEDGSSTIPWDICRVVPLLELIFSFNGFHVMTTERLEYHLNLLNFEPSVDPKINHYDRDTIILTHLLKGHILRQLNRWDEAYDYISQIQHLPPNCHLKNISTFGQFELTVLDFFNTMSSHSDKNPSNLFNILANGKDTPPISEKRIDTNNTEFNGFYKRIDSLAKLNAQGELEDRLQFRLQWLKDDLDSFLVKS